MIVSYALGVLVLISEVTASPMLSASTSVALDGVTYINKVPALLSNSCILLTVVNEGDCRLWSDTL